MSKFTSPNDGKKDKLANVPIEVRKFKDTIIKDVANTKHGLNGTLNNITYQIESRKDVTTEQKEVIKKECHNTKLAVNSAEKDVIKKTHSANDLDKLLEIRDYFKVEIKSASSRFAKLVGEIDEIRGRTLMEETANSLNLSDFQLENLLYKLEDFQLRKHDFAKNMSKDRELDHFLDIKK